MDGCGMNGCLDNWLDGGQVDGWIDGRWILGMVGWMNGMVRQIDGFGMNRYLDKWLDICMDFEMSKWIDD